MTEKLYDKDSHLKEFTATVIDCYEKADGYFTILDRTAFFPEGGGQASDIGYINDIEVYDVQEDDGIIYHHTASPFNKGETVVGKLNFERRFDFMQQHSAEHIVSGIANKYYGCENVGFHLGADIVTLDFDKPLTREEKKAYLATIKGVALGSDAFFPFGDNIERAAKSGVTYIAEPGGSIRDDNVIEACNNHGMVMAFTKMRLFHH